MKEKLLEILNGFGYPVFLQGTMNADQAYPETFITFWVAAVDDGSHYDDRPSSFAWEIDVYFYSADPSLTNTKPDEIRKALRAAGFIPDGKGWDTPSDEPTHTGWAQTFRYIEINKEE